MTVLNCSNCSRSFPFIWTSDPAIF